jgi:hypothetical protein
MLHRREVGAVSAPIVIARAAATANVADLEGEPTIDGISSWLDYDSILLTGQTDAKENGLYFWRESGEWQRVEGLFSGSYVQVLEGTDNAGLWRLEALTSVVGGIESTFVLASFPAKGKGLAVGSIAFGPTLAAGATAEGTITAAGVSPGDGVTATPNGDPGAGTVWSAWIETAGQVKVRIANPTGGTVTLTTRTWRADVWR